MISSLRPYTKYVFQVAVSNFYTDYRADVLGTPLVTRTLAGGKNFIYFHSFFPALFSVCLSYAHIRIFVVTVPHIGNIPYFHFSS